MPRVVLHREKIFISRNTSFINYTPFFFFFLSSSSFRVQILFHKSIYYIYIENAQPAVQREGRRRKQYKLLTFGETRFFIVKLNKNIWLFFFLRNADMVFFLERLKKREGERESEPARKSRGEGGGGAVSNRIFEKTLCKGKYFFASILISRELVRSYSFSRRARLGINSIFFY